MKRKEPGWKFLWVTKRKLLWGVVFGLMMALPGILGAQMKADVNILVSTMDGVGRVNTIYTSQFTDGHTQGVQQNQYLNNVVGFGGPTTVGFEFQNDRNSEIVFAGLSILKEGLGSGKTTMLTALEKIGVGNEDSRASFVAAGGSQISVTEALHATQASTLGGNLAYQVQSSGVGSMEAGVAGKFCTDCVKCEEPSDKGKIEDLRLQAGQQVQQAQANLMAGFQQHVETHVDFSGRYSGIFQAIIAPPK